MKPVYVRGSKKSWPVAICGLGRSLPYRDGVLLTHTSPLRALLLFLLLSSYAYIAAAQAGGTFAPTGNLTGPRTLHMATLLADGRVLIAGGMGIGERTLANAELYDPIFAEEAFSISFSSRSTTTCADPAKSRLLAGFSILIYKGCRTTRNRRWRALLQLRPCSCR